ncbi:MAG: sulfotransferase family 2 domain-containing protein [Chloroflexota bacterium]|nr:sulfotransferase family 2 domain-containing protein [Chloroflexota bacterium]
MIVSHKHKYLFVELPHTGSTAISKELRENYDGVPILRKHAYYHEFLRVAKSEEKTYFVFAGMRNPLDEAISVYFKYKNNHKQNYTNPERLRKNGGHVTDDDLRKFNFIKNNNADFPTFFARFYRLPYNNLSILSHKRFDFIIRFENLQDDFAQALTLIGITQKRPLPMINRTAGKKKEFSAYYTPEIYEQARRVFGPFMRRWDYAFPPEWGDRPVPRSSQMQYYIIGTMRKLYWKHLKWGSSLSAQLYKRLASSGF